MLSAPGGGDVSASRIDALLSSLNDVRLPLIAVSGGPDSTALLVMAAEWAARRGKPLAAATVDHGLRPDSATEAKAVAALCARLGVAHRTLVWTGQKPSTRIQERAREARYRLLIEHARGIGADAVVTAHHADDQAETVLIRLLHGSGIAGLRGMGRETVRDGIAVVRPLLGLPKEELIRFCRLRGVLFADDPSNGDPRYARAALKPALVKFAKVGLDRDAWARLARRAGEAEEALALFAARIETQLGAEGPIDARALFGEPIAVVQRVLVRRIAAAGGREPSRIGLEKIEALAAALQAALAEKRAFRANVGGAIARLDASGALDFAPEPPRRAPRRR